MERKCVIRCIIRRKNQRNAEKRDESNSVEGNKDQNAEPNASNHEQYRQDGDIRSRVSRCHKAFTSYEEVGDRDDNDQRNCGGDEGNVAAPVEGKDVSRNDIGASSLS